MKKLWISCVLTGAMVVFVGLGFVPVTSYASSVFEFKPKTEHILAKSEKGEGKESGEFTYLHMQPLVVPMIGPDGAEQIVTLLVDLQVKDLKVSEEVRVKMPRVQDSIVQELYAGFSDGSLRDGDRVDIPKVKARIGVALEKVLGGKVVDDVLIQGVAQRKL